jgi:PadR family transcriptional regulator PadR
VAGSNSQGDLRGLVLGLLVRREMYGYEVATALSGRFADGAAAEGSVYPVLRRLERDGLVSAHWVEIGEGAPRRRYYVLTPAGERQAAAGAARAARPASAIARCQGARP